MRNRLKQPASERGIQHSKDEGWATIYHTCVASETVRFGGSSLRNWVATFVNCTWTCVLVKSGWSFLFRRQKPQRRTRPVWDIHCVDDRSNKSRSRTPDFSIFTSRHFPFFFLSRNASCKSEGTPESLFAEQCPLQNLSAKSAEGGAAAQVRVLRLTSFGAGPTSRVRRCLAQSATCAYRASQGTNQDTGSHINRQVQILHRAARLLYRCWLPVLDSQHVSCAHRVRNPCMLWPDWAQLYQYGTLQLSGRKQYVTY